METGIDPISVCSSFGFDDARIHETIVALGIRAEHAELAERIRREIIGDAAERIVDACLAALASLPEAARVEADPSAPACRQALSDQLRRFGSRFDTPEYFAEYLALSTTRSHAGFSLRMLLLQQHVTQQVLLERLHDRVPHDSDAARALASCILKLTALNLLLIMEGFHRHQAHELQEALDRSRAEAARLHQSVATDALTGAITFSHAMKELDSQIRKAAGSGRPLCVMMADLDFFKKVNDTYGHLVGDIVLKHTAERIKSAVRDFDVVGRFGGEEFVVFLANTDLALGKVIAERIRHGIAQTPFRAKRFTIDVTISIGVALLKPGETREALLERADAAMYQAKGAGRNKVVVAEDIEGSASAQGRHADRLDGTARGDGGA